MSSGATRQFGKCQSSSKLQAAAPRDPREKRASGRRKVYKNSKIILSDRSLVECIARDVSDEGCRISVAGAENLPDEFTIQLDAFSGPRRAKVIWLDQNEAGLVFLE